MASDELEAQIAAEAKEIESAPKVPISAMQPRSSGRCGFCGKFCDDLVYVETFHSQDRYKGVACCGGGHTY